MVPKFLFSHYVTVPSINLALCDGGDFINWMFQA